MVELVIVTGMSGAGKSTAANALEDIGYYCIDNIPPSLIRPLIDLSLCSRGELAKIAIITDIRGMDMFGEINDVFEELTENDIKFKLLFLDSSDEVLTRRYKETRRIHPLSAMNSSLSTAEAIKREREILKPLRERADFVVDTSYFASGALKSRLTGFFLGDSSDSMPIQCISFGFKHGSVEEADIVLDVRCLPNPFYVDKLRPLTGLDEEIREYVLSSEHTQGFLQRVFSLLDYSVPLYCAEGKSQLVIAIGCTGGKHRSVVLTEEVCRHLKEGGYRASANHRDINRA